MLGYFHARVLSSSGTLKFGCFNRVCFYFRVPSRSGTFMFECSYFRPLSSSMSARTGTHSRPFSSSKSGNRKATDHLNKAKYKESATEQPDLMMQKPVNSTPGKNPNIGALNNIYSSNYVTLRPANLLSSCVKNTPHLLLFILWVSLQRQTSEIKKQVKEIIIVRMSPVSLLPYGQKNFLPIHGSTVPSPYSPNAHRLNHHPIPASHPSPPHSSNTSFSASTSTPPGNGQT